MALVAFPICGCEYKRRQAETNSDCGIQSGVCVFLKLRETRSCLKAVSMVVGSYFSRSREHRVGTFCDSHTEGITAVLLIECVWTL